MPENRHGIGMTVGDSASDWSINECLDAVTAVRATYPDVRGGFLWDTGRPGLSDWAAEVAPALTAPRVA